MRSKHGLCPEPPVSPIIAGRQRIFSSKRGGLAQSASRRKSRIFLWLFSLDRWDVVVEEDPERQYNPRQGYSQEQIINRLESEFEQRGSALFSGKPTRLKRFRQLKTSPDCDQQEWNQYRNIVSDPLQQVSFVQLQSP